MKRDGSLLSGNEKGVLLVWGHLDKRIKVKFVCSFAHYITMRALQVLLLTFRHTGA